MQQKQILKILLLKNSVETEKFAKKVELAGLKSNVEKINVDILIKCNN